MQRSIKTQRVPGAEGAKDAGSHGVSAGQLFFGISYHKVHKQRVCIQCVFSCALSDCCSEKMICRKPRTCGASLLQENGN